MSKPHTFSSKEDWLLSHVLDRKVLDLGCIDHNLDRFDRPWLHGFVAKNAKECLGVDILQSEIETLQSQGYSVTIGDVENLEIDDTFEAIVAGDIIEHLSNPGAIFETARKHLQPGGCLLVSTPNPIGIRHLITTMVRGESGCNSEHTCWFTSGVLRELGSRFGFRVEQECYIDDVGLNFGWKRGWRGGPLSRVKAVAKRIAWVLPLLVNTYLCRFRPRLCETVALSFRLRSDSAL